MTTETRRAPVQRGCHFLPGRPEGTCRTCVKPKGSPVHHGGTITWAEHEEAWNDYAKRYPGQTSERIAERGGFGFSELVDHLGHEPRTWEARQ